MKNKILFLSLLPISFLSSHAFALGRFGGDFDSESNLIDLRARNYDPEVGAFISKDPIGIRGGINLYSYVFSNPVNMIDPEGKAAITFYAEPLPVIGTHGALIITDVEPDSSAFVVEAGPAKNQGDAASALKNALGVPGVFGTLKAFEVVPIDSYTISNRFGSAKAIPLVTDDKPASYYIQQVEKLNKHVNELQLTYSVWGPNSNSYIRFVGEELGLPAFKPNANAFGWGYKIPSQKNQSGVLIDKAAELVGSNLADIKGATYDPESNQIIFLGSNTTPGVEGIDMDYFYTAVQAVYGSAIPPYVSLDAPASAASLWQDLGDGDGSFEAGEWGGFSLRYNPLWSEEDGTVAVRVRCRIGATAYDFNVNFAPQTISWLEYPNGQKPMHLVFAGITGNAPPGIGVWDGPFTTLPFPQTVLDYVNTSSNVNGGQDWTYPFQLYNGGTGTITNISFAVIPDRQHRRFGGRLEGTKLGWVLQEADRIMKCLAIGTDNVTGATYTSATVPIAGYKNLAEINAAGTSVSGNTRVWFLADQMKLKRHVDPATGRATIVFDQAVVGVKTESALNFQAQSPGVAAFASHLQTNFDAFASIPSFKLIRYQRI